VPRSKGRPEAYKALFKSQGYEVIDLTLVHPWEKPEVEAVAIEIAAKEKKPEKPKGLLKLNAVVKLNGSPHQREVVWAGLDPKKKVIKPKAVLIMSRTSSSITSQELRFLRNEFGEDIGVCVSTTQRDKYIKEGAMEINDFIEAQFLHYLQNHSSILSYLYHHPDYYRKIDGGVFTNIMEAADAYYPLAKSLGIVSYLTKRDKDWLDFWTRYTSSFNSRQRADKTRRNQIEAILSAPPVPPELAALSKKIMESRTIRFIDVFEIKQTVTNVPRLHRDSNYLTKLVGARLLLTALKG
jgi:hypothetical protein